MAEFFSSKNHKAPAKPEKAKPEKAPKVEAVKPTEQAKEGLTAVQEAERRIAEGIAAPNAMDFEAAASPAAAQLLAEVALLMAGQPTPPEEAPTTEEFLDDHGLEATEGRSHEDMQSRQNIEVAKLSSLNPPKELAEQRAEAMQHIPKPVVPESTRSLSLEELGRKRVEMTNPGAPLTQPPVETAA